jgi:hypothetical protein
LQLFTIVLVAGYVEEIPTITRSKKSKFPFIFLHFIIFHLKYHTCLLFLFYFNYFINASFQLN